jgi:glycosyltransferase involved in cell wall biosynthesis
MSKRGEQLIALNWPLSSVTGYGIYGLQILMQHMRRGGRGFVLTDAPIPPIFLPPPFDRSLAPLLVPASEAARRLHADPTLSLNLDMPVLHGVGSDFAGFKNQDRVKGRANIGCAALEERHATPEWAAYLRRYDKLIAISRWNAAFLTELNVAPVHLCHQGIDADLFKPSSVKRTDGRFAIFSGGKFEFRKGQDIVLAAFKRFRARRPQAQLVVSWHNMHVPDAAPFAAAGHCANVPSAAPDGKGLDIAAWLVAEGLPPDSFVVLPWLASADMAKVVPLCDMAVFPNRCEGGTNLVAMEAIACGVPTFVSYNSGHKDLVDLIGCGALRRQTAVAPHAPYRSMDEWGESDVEEVVEAMERTHNDAQAAKAAAQPLSAIVRRDWTWAARNEHLLQKIFS